MPPVSVPFWHFSPFSSCPPVSKPSPQKTKIARKLTAVGCKAVLPELIFVQARQSPKRILDVFARVLTQHGRKSACQNRHGFNSRQLIRKEKNGAAAKAAPLRLSYCTQTKSPYSTLLITVPDAAMFFVLKKIRSRFKSISTLTTIFCVRDIMRPFVLSK